MLVLSLLIQAGLIVHVIKTGRNMLWIWAIALLPLAGPLAYVVVEVLPSLFGGNTARRARSSVKRMIDPNRDLRRASAEVALSGNVDARRRLAEEMFERGQYDGAIEACRGGLTGIFEHDPTLLLGLARAQFAKQDYQAARGSLERLAGNNPEFKSSEARLLYARTLEAEGALGPERTARQRALESRALPPGAGRMAGARAARTVTPRPANGLTRQAFPRSRSRRARQCAPPTVRRARFPPSPSLRRAAAS